MFRISAAQVAAYVAATGDDARRWTSHAPPSFAGAVLFTAAPSFFADPDVAPHTRLLIHGDQSFSWTGPWLIGSSLSVTARIARLRVRARIAFVTFMVEAVDDRERKVMVSRSLFLMSREAPPGGRMDEREEPGPEARRENRSPVAERLPSEQEALRRLPKSASRADLIRYAAASQDFNPIHWDHGRALASGVGGVICHGLLMAAWATQPAAATVDRPDPLASARFRFRRPLYPDRAAVVASTVTRRSDGSASIDAAVVSEAGRHLTATMTVRTGQEDADR